MSSSWRERRLPVASIADDETAHGRLVFPNSDELNRAWDLGIFYLKTLDNLDLESARRFGRALINRDSPHRKVPQFGELEVYRSLCSSSYRVSVDRITLVSTRFDAS